MDKTEAESFAQEQLESFKVRMRIDGDSEDDNLKMMLSSSFERMTQLVGPYTKEDLVFKELVFERSRYYYNDALEYFELNFHSRIMDHSFIKMAGGSNATV